MSFSVITGERVRRFIWFSNQHELCCSFVQCNLLFLNFKSIFKYYLAPLDDCFNIIGKNICVVCKQIHFTIFDNRGVDHWCTKKKRSGHRTDLSGKPCVMSLILDELSLNRTNCLQLERKDCSNRSTVSRRPYLSHLARSNWSSTVSTAFDKSSKVHWKCLCCCFRSSNASTISIIASTVERLCRKPTASLTIPYAL